MALVARNRVTPPWKADPAGQKFIGLDPLTDSEITSLERWVADGAREGDRRDSPASPRWTDGWQLGTPDLAMLPTPFVLSADGSDVSRVFVLPLPVDRQRFVRGIEFRANNPRIDHANIRIDATPASRELDEQDATPGYDSIIRAQRCIRMGISSDGLPARPLLFTRRSAWTLAPRSDLVVRVTSCRAENRS